MKSVIKICCLLFFSITASAQDSVINITPAIFEKGTDQAFIANMDGWLYKEGNDTAWAAMPIDVSSWKKLKPTDLSAKFADKDGKLECWFRAKIKIDSTLTNLPLSVKLNTWAATDLYIDGKYITSRGSTGYDGRPYHENSPYGYASYPVDLEPGHEYIVAIHMVDHLTAIPPFRLQSEQTGLAVLIRILGKDYNSVFLVRGIKEPAVYDTLWTAVCATLTLLFWLLYFQNRTEKNLRLIALGSTFFTLTIYCNIQVSNSIGMSFNTYTLYDCCTALFLTLGSLMMPLILANIFRRKISSALKIALVIYFIFSMTGQFLDPGISALFTTCSLAFIFSVCGYYVISSWKNLKGAQWAIVVGLLCSLFFGLLFLFTNILFNAGSTLLYYLSITTYALSFPISLLVYVSTRFKEIIKEVQQNAQTVIQLSEEKEQQALNQQQILQEEVNRQTAEIRTALDNLKAAQSQLIQSEKMAGLGELTAGIAHEIQNPLNFVNNFSEVSNELIDEMKIEFVNGNINEAFGIADDLKHNLEKITHHGKRADAIVKGMLQHSRTSSGQKELTDINMLCDEYLRLSFHGLRAKDKSFNAKFETHFESSLPKISVVPQDIGRVLLNLINNAFYAVREKKKLQIDAYEPAVSVSSKKINGSIEIKVSDNGNGIPDSIKEKIFQPFFTTKPTGQGTGLGLSLSYDIIKAHGGELQFKSTEGEGTVFEIKLFTTHNA